MFFCIGFLQNGNHFIKGFSFYSDYLLEIRLFLLYCFFVSGQFITLFYYIILAIIVKLISEEVYYVHMMRSTELDALFAQFPVRVQERSSACLFLKAATVSHHHFNHMSTER